LDEIVDRIEYIENSAPKTDSRLLGLLESKLENRRLMEIIDETIKSGQLLVDFIDRPENWGMGG
jgi:hypothetical protein